MHSSDRRARSSSEPPPWRRERPDGTGEPSHPRVVRLVPRGPQPPQEVDEGEAVGRRRRPQRCPAVWKNHRGRIAGRAPAQGACAPRRPGAGGPNRTSRKTLTPGWRASLSPLARDTRDTGATGPGDRRADPSPGGPSQFQGSGHVAWRTRQSGMCTDRRVPPPGRLRDGRVLSLRMADATRSGTPNGPRGDHIPCADIHGDI